MVSLGYLISGRNPVTNKNGRQGTGHANFKEKSLMSTTAPFRADHVGSFLRTEPLKQARAKHEQKQISDAQLKEVEDREIETLIRKQEEVGLKLATDGEFRRAFWHFDFYGMLDGVEVAQNNQAIQFKGVQSKPQSIRVTGKIDFSDTHPMLEHFRFLKSRTRVVPKMTIPAPTVFHFRMEPNAVAAKQIYAENDAVFDDLAAAYRKAVKAFYDAGCRYLQFDDTAWAYLCSPVEMKNAKERGIKTDRVIADYANLIRKSIADKPADMVITTHVCRGNFRSAWISEGGYEPVAEQLLGNINYDGYFLEYDSDRAGGFEPLRFMPKGKKKAVLGLITSKSGTLESKDAVKRRLDEATKYIALDQCCLSPQCGFASTEEGNVLTEDQQWAKMREIVELAEEVWGE
jgi:5-methyltetrahydropteroyltriglutamate--homocysteine methyltransferase